MWWRRLGLFWSRWGWNWLPVLIWMGLIFFLSAQPKSNLFHYPDQLVDLVLKKAGHMTEYGVLALLLWRAISPLIGQGGCWHGWFVVVICLLYALSDEYHQSFVSGRRSAWQDVLIDVLGACVALFLMSVLLRERDRSRSRFRRCLWLDRFLGGFRPLRFVPEQDAAE